MLERWQTMDLYGKIRKAAAARPLWILHDGPPYANGHIHMGTALNKILKDFVTSAAPRSDAISRASPSGGRASTDRSACPTTHSTSAACAASNTTMRLNVPRATRQ